MPVISALRGDILAVQLPHSILCCIRNGNIQLVFQHTNIKPDIGIRKALACLHRIVNQISDQRAEINITHRKIGRAGCLVIHADAVLFGE